MPNTYELFLPVLGLLIRICPALFDSAVIFKSLTVIQKMTNRQSEVILLSINLLASTSRVSAGRGSLSLVEHLSGTGYEFCVEISVNA